MIDAKLIKELEYIVGFDQLFSRPDQMAYACSDMSTNVRPEWPALVVKVRSKAELIRVTRECLRFRQPLVVRGAGTGKSGGAVPHLKAVVIDTMALNSIDAINKTSLTADVEPGVILGDFKKALTPLGLFYPPDPASWARCTIGGNVAENAGGPSAFKYGSTRDYVLGGQAILGTGEVIDFGKRCVKGVAGYDITSLLCGSEGTLAVFSSFILRLLPLPLGEAVGLFFFENDHDALKAVLAIFENGFIPRTLEFIDSTCIKALKKEGLLDKAPAGASVLLLECDAEGAQEALAKLQAIEQSLKKTSLLRAQFAKDNDEAMELWRIRASLSEACSHYLGHKLSEDIALPLEEMLQFSEWFKAQKEESLQGGLFGHAGDGNFHVQIMFSDESHLLKALALRHEVLLQVVKLRGTLSAEHGIGLQKINYLPLEQGPALIALQKRIKNAFDPYNLLNPGKIFAS